MKSCFQTIGLIAKPGDSAVASTLATLSGELERRNLSILLDPTAAAYFDAPSASVMDRTELITHCDLAIVVGGDGTLLNASRSLARANVPVLGVNLGRLGFLADVSPNEMCERLNEILAGEYEEEHRSLLHATVLRADEVVSESNALNDVVVHKWDIARMIEVDTHIDDRYLNTVRADGLIVSTPTGSTAYALSGGGPILDPGLDALVLVPICPHTLSNRPIVVSDKVQIDIRLHGDTYSKAQITCDGQVNFALIGGDLIRIQKEGYALRLIHPRGHDHFDIMRKKLHWAEQP
ncbi:NAD kinase [hydrothermal vent metagenome]|uniref:NAD kinase n=1 Tax=hydrothermal vent metagenome TaxID=652676 RepID=A0A3B0Y9D0_9ZZZZ